MQYIIFLRQPSWKAWWWLAIRTETCSRKWIENVEVVCDWFDVYTYDMFGKQQWAIISFVILALSCPYLRLSAWNISVATRQISVQFDTRVIKNGPAIFLVGQQHLSVYMKT
jgi:hypothetical protein